MKIKLIGLLTLIFIFTSCVGIQDMLPASLSQKSKGGKDLKFNSGSRSRTPANVEGSEAYKKMMGVLKQDCLACHSLSAQSYNTDPENAFFFDDTASERQFVAAHAEFISPGNPEQAELTYRLHHSPSALQAGLILMPMGVLGPRFSVNDYKIFEDWMLSLEQTFVPNIRISQTNVISNNANPVVGVGCTANFPVSLSISGQNLGTVNCNEQGRANFTITNFFQADGNYQLDFSQTVSLFNLTDQGSIYFSLDTSAPNLQILAPTNNSNTGQNIHLQGICESGLTVNITGDIVVSAAPNCDNGNFSSNIILSSGFEPKTVIATQTDSAGNVTTISHTYHFINSTNNLAPHFTLTPPSNTSTQGPFNVEGDCVHGLDINISGANGNLVCDSNGKYSGTLNLTGSDGIKVVNFAQTSSSNQSTQHNLVMTLDTTSPVTTFQTNLNGQTFGNQSVLLSYNCEAALNLRRRVTKDGQLLTEVNQICSSQGFYNENINFAGTGSGPVSIEIYQIDGAGNSTTNQITITLDQSGPNLAVNNPTAGQVIETPEFNINGSGCENNGSVVTIQIPNQEAETRPCNSSSFQLSNAKIGYNYGATDITVAQDDSLGNNSTVTRQVHFRPLENINTPWEKAKYVLNNHCLSCHYDSNAIEYGRFVNLTATHTQEQFLNDYGDLVTPGNAATSELIIRMIGTPNGDMPSDTSVYPTEYYQAMVDWVNSLSALPVQVVSISSPVDGSTQASNFTVAGSCQSNQSLTLSIGTNTQNINCSANGDFTYNAQLNGVSGQVNITATQTPPSGSAANLYTAQVTVSIASIGTNGPGRQPANQDEIDQLDAVVELQLVGKTFLANKFEQVFGPGSLSIVEPNILKVPDLHGGNCSMNESEKVIAPAPNGYYNADLAFPKHGCRENNTTLRFYSSSVVPLPNTAQRGFLIKTCEQLVEESTTRNYALNRANIAPGSALTNQNVEQIFRLFFPFDTLDTDLLNRYMAIDQLPGRSNDDKLDTALLVTCANAAWTRK